MREMPIFNDKISEIILTYLAQREDFHYMIERFETPVEICFRTDAFDTYIVFSDSITLASEKEIIEQLKDWLAVAIEYKIINEHPFRVLVTHVDYNNDFEEIDFILEIKNLTIENALRKWFNQNMSEK